MRPGCEPVAPVGSRRGVDGVAEVAQPVDVTAHGSFGDLETFGEFRAAPHPVGLQQREQLQGPSRRIVSHGLEFITSLRTDPVRNALYGDLDPAPE